MIPNFLYVIGDEKTGAFWTLDGWLSATTESTRADVWYGESKEEAERELKRIAKPGDRLIIAEVPKALILEHCDPRLT